MSTLHHQWGAQRTLHIPPTSGFPHKLGKGIEEIDILGYANGSRDIQRHCKHAKTFNSTETVELTDSPRRRDISVILRRITLNIPIPADRALIIFYGVGGASENRECTWEPERGFWMLSDVGDGELSDYQIERNLLLHFEGGKKR